MDFTASKRNQFRWRDVTVGNDVVVPWEADGFPYRFVSLTNK
jgi:hypothetical protein